MYQGISLIKKVYEKVKEKIRSDPLLVYDIGLPAGLAALAAYGFLTKNPTLSSSSLYLACAASMGSIASKALETCFRPVVNEMPLINRLKLHMSSQGAFIALSLLV